MCLNLRLSSIFVDNFDAVSYLHEETAPCDQRRLRKGMRSPRLCECGGGR